MFPSNTFSALPCPISKCARGDHCFFSHSIQRDLASQIEVPTIDATHVAKKARLTLAPCLDTPTPMATPIKRVEPFVSPVKASIVQAPHHQTVQVAAVDVQAIKPIVSFLDIHPLASKPFLAKFAPLLKASKDSKISTQHRQKVVGKLFEQFTRLYTSINDTSPFLAHIHALLQESRIHTSASKNTYITLSVGVMSRLKARGPAVSVADTGLDGEYVARRKDLTRADIEGFLCTEAALIDSGYPFVGLFNFPYNLKTDWMCERCDLPYSDDTCEFHFGYIMQQRSLANERIYSCCLEKVPNPGCATSKHVFKTDELSSLHHTTPFVTTPEVNEAALDIIALDCEMVYTTAGFEMVDVAGEMLVDVLCKTKGEVIDLNTIYSGITTLETAIHDLESARALLFSHISSNTIIVGHGLENDLRVLRIVDTAILFVNPRGAGYKYALRNLAKLYLGKFIQTSLAGHSPLEDSSTCIDLLHARLAKGFRDHKSKV